MIAPRPIAALFVRRDSIYKTMVGVDAWDEDRDALKWLGGCPVVAHPPCRLWGRLHQFSKADPSEKQLAIWSIAQILKWGGVLEHPIHSRLYSRSAIPDMPAMGDRDAFGGYLITVAHWWFGHRAEKWTKLYICGVDPTKLPIIPLKIGEAPCVIDTSRNNGKGSPGFRPTVTKPEREQTPPAFAEWLVSTARRCG